MNLRAAILDVDGVLTSTAALHERVWKQLFDAELRRRGDSQPFTHADYRAHVDGKPRLDGLRDFLGSRGITISDEVAGTLAKMKNQRFRELLAREGVEAFPDAVRQIRAWRRAGLPVAFVSSSRNAARVLRAGGLDHLCDVRVDGRTAQEMGLHGKPDLLLEAARRLTVEPARALVVEDAVAGVEAAARLGFGLVIGVARGDGAAMLREHGAHRVVRRLDELADIELADLHPDGDAAWCLHYEGHVPELEGLRESLCTLGNGRFGTRGAAEEAQADRWHYPGTYLAGGYDRLASEVDGQLLVHEDLVNWPNWLGLSFRPEGGVWWTPGALEVLAHEQRLDFRRGELTRRTRVRDREGRTSELTTRRLVSMHDPHLAALRWELVPLDWSGPLELRSGLDGAVKNDGVARYRPLRGDHLRIDETGHDDATMWLVACTGQSRLRVALVARTTAVDGCPGAPTRTQESVEDRVSQTLTLEAAEGRPIAIDKIVALHSARDHATSEPLTDARVRIADAPGFEALLGAHARAWSRLWRRVDIDLGAGHEETNRILRLHIFHLLQVASPHVVDRDVGVPARGLHGEAYRGHIFWDELFIFPLLNYAVPELTRALLMYRYHRLGAARRRARELGYSGAAYPWQSGSSGREETPRAYLNPRSGRWICDETEHQHHISAAVAWNVWSYYEVSGDHAWLGYYGAEMLLEIASFWASIATWDPELARYRIRGVVGPDEFHTAYPDADKPGLDDNAYTNVMAAWCLRIAERALDELSEARRTELLETLGLDDVDRRRWAQVAAQLRVPFHDDGHIISQFEGYAALQELDWDAYRARHGDIHRLDLVLEAEADSPNHYKASKQADTLMLFYLFRADDLVALLAAMGYAFDPAWIPENVAYYLRRTSHGSTLSRVVHAWGLARSDRAHSYRVCQEALRSDVDDIQGGTTPEGIHLGAMAGAVDLIKRAYTGAVMREGTLWLEPRLPDALAELRTRFRVRGAWLDVYITHHTIEVEYTGGDQRRGAARVGALGVVHTLERGQRRRFVLLPETQEDSA